MTVTAAPQEISMSPPDDEQTPRKTWNRNPEGKYYGGGWPGPRKKNVQVGLNPDGDEPGSLPSVDKRAAAAGVPRAKMLRELVEYADKHMPQPRPSDVSET
jgi:hypothetical protein